MLQQSFDDLHKLWYVLYKERNLLLTTKQKLRRTQRPVIAAEEFRYTKVKRSMAGIKHVLEERKKIDKLLGVSSSIPKTPSTLLPKPKQDDVDFTFKYGERVTRKISDNRGNCDR